ncbi:MAG: maleylpyruvate isomerase N-terminal domain-containing protein [Thermoanaerobaculia bacterium]
MEPAGRIDTAHLFAPLHDELLALLRSLRPEDWERPTVAGVWRVRDVAAHLLDTQLRRLSFQRDGHALPPPEAPIAGDRDLVGYLNRLNAEWILAARRLSPRVLMELLKATGPALTALLASLPPREPALFPVSWAGQAVSENWFDVGREYTEHWHHQAQIRDAVGAPGLDSRRFLHPVLELSLYALPVALRGAGGAEGNAVVVEITGEAGGTWSLLRTASDWTLWRGEAADAALRARLDSDSAWRLFFNALSPDEARRHIAFAGDATLSERLIAARGVMV